MYVRKKKKPVTVQKFDYKHHLELLEDEDFYFQIVFLTSIITELNETNKALQGSQLDIHLLKTKLIEILQWLAKLLIFSEKIPPSQSSGFVEH